MMMHSPTSDNSQRSNDLWKNYRSVVFETFPDLKFEKQHVHWTNKRDVHLTADLYSGQYFIKSRHVDIWDDKLNIHNNVIYPKTGANLPCFGMDLMGFFEKKVIIVFDFQHPVENYLLDVPPLPKTEETYRFFEPGNHFSNNIFVRYCEMSQVDTYLSTFKYYLSLYKEMIEKAKPTGMDTSLYHDFDKYMIRLDPISGYLSNAFGKEESEKLIREFFFSYA
tara:strand:- start:14601 stop:15266 length:666 start_codon:yes stop_codon:yes gene_type:complete